MFLIAIENIKTGDKVISTNSDTFETAHKTVLETYIRKVNKLVYLTIAGALIITTVDHPFYVRNQDFVSASELQVGYETVNSNGDVLLVEDIKIKDNLTPTTVYNFQVVDFHTYHVSKFGVLVHNADYNQSPKEVISERTKELDKQEHPTKNKQISAKEKTKLKTKLNDRTITKDEYKRLKWNEKISQKRQNGVNNFWEQERTRLQNGENGTRNWTSQQKIDILNGGRPKYNGQTLRGHHSYSVSKYPNLADKGEVVFPATQNEHFNGWHGRNYKNSLPGEPINTIIDF